MRTIILAAATASILAAACGTRGTTTTSTGTGGIPGTGGSTGTGGSAGDAGIDAGNPCAVCAPAQPAMFAFPDLVWFGDKQDAPPCPAIADVRLFASDGDPTTTLDCGTCTCGAPTGSCTLPATMTANAASCAQNGSSTTHTPFDPAGSWNGTCDTNDPIPSGKLCGGVDCVQSLTVAPVKLTETGCTPSPSPPPVPPTFGTYAFECTRQIIVDCSGGPGATCVPEPPPGFHVCVRKQDVVNCTDPALGAGPYTETHLLFGGITDTQQCAACTCGPPTGSTCSSTVSVYTDGACATSAYSATIDASGPACHDLPPGTPLGSKAATPPTYTPGTCAPGGGGIIGSFTPNGPVTWCCIPQP